MTKIISKFIAELLEDFIGNIIDSILGNIVQLALSVEKYMSSYGINGFDKLFTMFSTIGISLIIIKFLKKGFDMYVLWTDGDADADPVQLVVNFIRAMVVALTFTFMYNYFAEIIIEISDEALNAIGLYENIESEMFLSLLKNLTISSLFGFLIFFIMYLILYVKFIATGFEILILRIAAPLACVGLMDADKGVFKTYIQKFFQVAFTILIQVLLTKLALSLIISQKMIWAIAAAYFAIKTPNFLKEFLVFSGNGGIMNSVYSGVKLGQMFKTIVK